MNELIYYPGFEINNLNWLKFALLYIDKLNPIIPRSGEKYLTELHRKLSDETDLIRTHRPTYDEGTKSTLDAMEIVEKILQHPSGYSTIFHTPNIKQKWQNKKNHNYILFKEKYTHEWENFCLGNKIAQKCDEGLLLSRELGFTYMTILAQTIADSRGISPITDHKNLDRFSILARKTNRPVVKKVEVAQSVLQLKLPANLEQIDLDRIIAFRNQKGFKSELHAFHDEFDRFYKNIEDGSTISDFVNSFKKTWNDFSDNVLQLGIGGSTFGIGVWILVNSPQITTANYLKEVLGGTSLIVGSIISIRSTWKNTKAKRYCRKYLTDLTTLKPAMTV